MLASKAVPQSLQAPTQDEVQQLHDIIMGCPLDGTVPDGVNSLTWLVQPMSVDIVGLLSHPRVPAAMYAREHMPHMVPPLIDVYTHSFVHKLVDAGADKLFKKLEQAAPKPLGERANRKHFDGVLSNLLLGISSLPTHGQEGELRRFTLEHLFSDPKSDVYRLMLDDKQPLDERQKATKRMDLALHIAFQAGKFAALDPAVATRSTARNQVALSVTPEGGVVRVELRAVQNFVMHGQPILDAAAARSYFGEREQNPGHIFRNDESQDPKANDQDSSFIAHVAKQYDITEKEAMQPADFQHSIGVDGFGIGMLLLQLLYGGVMNMHQKRDQLIKFWTEYKQVSNQWSYDGSDRPRQQLIRGCCTCSCAGGPRTTAAAQRRILDASRVCSRAGQAWASQRRKHCRPAPGRRSQLSEGLARHRAVDADASRQRPRVACRQSHRSLHGQEQTLERRYPAARSARAAQCAPH